MEDAKRQILEWTVPECPYRVTIAANVINEIRILAVEAFYSVPRGGVEIGGVLFGIHERECLHIRAHRPIQCQYATGPSFTLSIKDQLGLSGLLEQALVDPDLAGMLPIGWYHSHTRSAIFLSAADLQLYNEFFPDRWQIAMVLQPVNLKPTRAAFFFRDRWGAVKSEAPIQEFTLEPPNFGLAPIEMDEPGVVVSSHDQLVEIPDPNRPAAKRQVLESPKQVPEEIPLQSAPAASVTLARGELSMPVSNGAGAAAAVLATAPPPVAVETLTASGPPEAPQPDDLGLPEFLAKSNPIKARRGQWTWAVLAAILLCGAGGGAALKWGSFYKSMDLGLETYDINGAFLIRWDRESKLLRSATRVTLEIEDGGEKTPIELTAAELGVGGYGYMRRTGQVSAHMRVEGPTPAEEYSNFNAAQALGSQQTPTAQPDARLNQTLKERERLKTELINESMQALALRREITSLRRQLAEALAKNGPAPNR